jgi:hypothetical protein
MGVGAMLGGGSNFVWTYAWVIVLWTIALTTPNTAQIMDRVNPALDYLKYRLVPHSGWRNAFIWTPTARWSVFAAFLFALSVLSMTRVSEFLYFQF